MPPMRINCLNACGTIDRPEGSFFCILLLKKIAAGCEQNNVSRRGAYFLKNIEVCRHAGISSRNGILGMHRSMELVGTDNCADKGIKGEICCGLGMIVRTIAIVLKNFHSVHSSKTSMSETSSLPLRSLYLPNPISKPFAMLR